MKTLRFKTLRLRNTNHRALQGAAPRGRQFDFAFLQTFYSGKSKWGLSKWGLKVLVHNCPRLTTIVVILWGKFPLERGPKRPQKCTIVDDCAQTAERGLKPPFESLHLDFPNLLQQMSLFHLKTCSPVKVIPRSAASTKGKRPMQFGGLHAKTPRVELRFAIQIFGCQIPWPFFSRELCRKKPNCGCQFEGGQWGFPRKTEGHS